MDCKQIQQQYKKLSDNVILFRTTEKDFRKERVTALACKKNIESVFLALSEVFGMKIKVENMPSPFAEVYTANRLPIPEKKTQEIDLEAQLEEDCAAYRECGLASWADNIETFLPRLKTIIRENKRQVARELQEGAIAIFMPGRAVQYANAVETLRKKLKPVRKENGEEKKVGDGYLKEPHIIAELEKIAREKTLDIPEVPYLMLTKPTQDSELTSKTVDEQIAEIVEMNKKRTEDKLAPVYSILPPEYVAMQKFFTARAESLKKKTGKRLFGKLYPLDSLGYTRFVSMRLSGGGAVPRCFWSVLGSLEFNCEDPSPSVVMGVRFVVRLF